MFNQSITHAPQTPAPAVRQAKIPSPTICLGDVFFRMTWLNESFSPKYSLRCVQPDEQSITQCRYLEISMPVFFRRRSDADAFILPNFNASSSNSRQVNMNFNINMPHEFEGCFTKFKELKAAIEYLGQPTPIGLELQCSDENQTQILNILGQYYAQLNLLFKSDPELFANLKQLVKKYEIDHQPFKNQRNGLINKTAGTIAGTGLVGCGLATAAVSFPPIGILSAAAFATGFPAAYYFDNQLSEQDKLSENINKEFAQNLAGQFQLLVKSLKSKKVDAENLNALMVCSDFAGLLSFQDMAKEK